MNVGGLRRSVAQTDQRGSVVGAAAIGIVVIINAVGMRGHGTARHGPGSAPPYSRGSPYVDGRTAVTSYITLAVG